MLPNLHNKQFKSEVNSDNGEVSDATVFTYHQERDVIWATYQGGQILKGHLLGKIIENRLEFVYHHINQSQELMTGQCTSYPELTHDGKIRLKEYWQWTCKDHSKGHSTLIEI